MSEKRTAFADLIFSRAESRPSVHLLNFICSSDVVCCLLFLPVINGAKPVRPQHHKVPLIISITHKMTESAKKMIYFMLICNKLQTQRPTSSLKT